MRNRILLLFVFCGLVASASAQSNFNRYTFNVGGGFGIGRDDVASFVGNSPQFTVGGGRNFSRLFGVDAEYMYYDLSLRPSVAESQSLLGARGHLQSVSLDGIVNVPRHIRKLGAYGIFGIGFYDRSVSLPHSQLLEPPLPCQPAWIWWNVCVNGTVLTPQTLSSASKVAGGFNYGAGATYRLGSSRAKLYVEWRYHRAYQSDVQTIVMPVSVGVRW